MCSSQVFATISHSLIHYLTFPPPTPTPTNTIFPFSSQDIVSTTSSSKSQQVTIRMNESMRGASLIGMEVCRGQPPREAMHNKLYPLYPWHARFLPSFTVFTSHLPGWTSPFCGTAESVEKKYNMTILLQNYLCKTVCVFHSHIYHFNRRKV